MGSTAKNDKSEMRNYMGRTKMEYWVKLCGTEGIRDIRR